MTMRALWFLSAICLGGCALPAPPGPVAVDTEEVSMERDDEVERDDDVATPTESPTESPAESPAKSPAKSPARGPVETVPAPRLPAVRDAERDPIQDPFRSDSVDANAEGELILERALTPPQRDRKRPSAPPPPAGAASPEDGN